MTALPHRETPETGVAFRAGVQGLPFSDQLGPRRELHVETVETPGPNERHMEMLDSLPGLSAPVEAYETGRALRMIGHIFDSQGSPVTFGAGFVQRLAEALLYFGLRGERQPWGAEDTIFVFLETCAPIEAPREVRDETRAAILKYARLRPEVRSPQARA